DNEVLRNASSVALAKIGEPAVPSLKRMLGFPAQETVEAAVEALAAIGPPAASAAPELEALAAKSPMSIRLGCLTALARIIGNPERSLNIIAGALGHDDPAIRKSAVEKIAGLGAA